MTVVFVMQSIILLYIKETDGRTADGAIQVKSSHLYLYSAFNNTDCVKALNSIKLEDRVSVMYNNKIKHSISVKGISLLNSEMSLSS